jgi:hypothetical protein
MKDPVSGRFVLPLTRLEQVAQYGHTAGSADAFSRIGRLNQSEDLMLSRHEEPHHR